MPSIQTDTTEEKEILKLINQLTTVGDFSGVSSEIQVAWDQKYASRWEQYGCKQVYLYPGNNLVQLGKQAFITAILWHEYCYTKERKHTNKEAYLDFLDEKITRWWSGEADLSYPYPSINTDCIALTAMLDYVLRTSNPYYSNDPNEIMSKFFENRYIVSHVAYELSFKKAEIYAERAIFTLESAYKIELDIVLSDKKRIPDSLTSPLPPAGKIL